MKELLNIIVENLVDNKDAIKINERQEDDVIILELTVSNEDVGKVIGKQGKIAKAIRTVIKSAASHEDKKVVVKIL
ncbi:KH domain-containing protein [uncultured Tyzzerella sp.]|uniref:KH domain-containing protein n=1 Tax=uncultured Tyzzerella sp. TaxID=2321398 RepID=UPI00294379C8|nr:KH domain-containing protein [uncultured Tyzzerella sp.]